MYTSNIYSTFTLLYFVTYTFSKFYIHILSIENLFKKSELIFKHYLTIIRPKKHWSPGVATSENIYFVRLHVK